jgi:mRNA interferase MazF
VSRAQRGEIWLIDLGMVAKTRPALILSVGYDEQERAVISYVPRTTSVRGTRFEVAHTARGFDPGAFDAQGIAGVPTVRLVRRLAMIDAATLAKVETAVKAWLGLP